MRGVLRLWARAQAQASPDPLVANEQFGVGGLDTVRGYEESEVLGDSGALLQTELRSPSLADTIGVPAVNELRFHAFGDTSYAAINGPLPEQKRSYSLNSVGAGVRVRVFDHYNGQVEGATALSNGPVTRSGSNRVLFRLFGDF